MKRKEALYAVVGGCVGAVLTMVVCSFHPLGAQSQSDSNFGKITCTELDVLNAEGEVVVHIGVLENGGVVSVNGNDGEPQASMGVFRNGGIVRVNGNDGESMASMGVLRNGGVVRVNGNDGKFKVLTKAGVR